MFHKDNLIIGIASTALIAVMLCPIISAEEPQKITDLTSVEELKTLASNGNGDAMLQLGEKLIPEQGIDSGATEALQWLQKAADAGQIQAWYDLGFIYANSAGVKEDLPAAVKYWQIGAEKGNADCQFSVGLVYQAGERIPGGVKADPVEAVKWYQLAAEQNHTEAIQHLAMMNSMGMGIKQDNLEAIKWFRKGAELGNADCIWGLGHCYLDGRGVPQDSVQAYALYAASLDGFMNPEQKQAYSERCIELGKRLTEEQLKRAEPLIAEWKAKGNK
jgi:TPR repeat protein